VSEAQATATDDLLAAGLAVGSIATQSSTTVANGSVVSEVPAAGTAVPALFPVSLIVSSGPPAKACSADASSLVSVSLSAIRYNAAMKLYEQTAAITNTSGSTISGPINLIVENLSSDANVQNASGMTTCNAPGSPYLANSHLLTSGQSLGLTIHFADPTKQPISWTAEVTAEGIP